MENCFGVKQQCIFIMKRNFERENIALFTLIDCALFKDESSVNTIINSCKIIVFLLYTNTRTFNTIKVIHEKCARAKRQQHKIENMREKNKRAKESKEKSEKTLNGWSRKVFPYFFFVVFCIMVGGKGKKETLHKIQFGCSVRAVSPYGLVRF